METNDYGCVDADIMPPEWDGKRFIFEMPSGKEVKLYSVSTARDAAELWANTDDKKQLRLLRRHLFVAAALGELRSKT